MGIDENISGTNHLNEPAANEDEIENCGRDRLPKRQYLRQVAEFDSFRSEQLKNGNKSKLPVVMSLFLYWK